MRFSEFLAASPLLLPMLQSYRLLVFCPELAGRWGLGCIPISDSVLAEFAAGVKIDPMKTTPLSALQIQAALRTRFIGQSLHLFTSIASTNDEAKRLAVAGAAEGTLVITDEQTAGKGRMGRRWLAPARTSLLFSLVFRPTLAPVHASRLTMLCSLAAAEAIEQETQIRISIKWPNDLVVPHPQVGYRKLGGLLTETALAGEQLLFVVVGMGINVNLPPAELASVMTPATSLSEELGRPVDRIPLLSSILEHVENLYLRDEGETIHARWKERLITLGQQITVSTVSERIAGTAEGVDSHGALFLRDLAGNLHRIQAGDVTLRT